MLSCVVFSNCITTYTLQLFVFVNINIHTHLISKRPNLNPQFRNVVTTDVMKEITISYIVTFSYFRLVCRLDSVYAATLPFNGVLTAAFSGLDGGQGVAADGLDGVTHELLTSQARLALL